MAPVDPLTRRQQAVLAFLLERERGGGVAPTLDELCEAMGLRSRGSMHKHISALIDAGLVEPMGRKQRGVRLSEAGAAARAGRTGWAGQAGPGSAGAPDLAGHPARLLDVVPHAAPSPDVLPPDVLPLYGSIAAGRPIEAIAGADVMEVPPSLRSSRPCYVLRVRGESMVEDGILDGDYVVVEQRDQAPNGAIVVALIDGHEATLKRILQRPGEVVLCPANSSMEAIRYTPDRVSIQGVVVGQMRQYR